MIAILAVAMAVMAGSTTVAAYTTVTYNGAGGAARIGLIGDSSLAAVRWANSYAPLRQFNYVFDAESCRRTATPSCAGREGYAPEHGLATLRRLSGQWGSVLVMVTGYNDPGTSFASSVDAIMAEASAQGIGKVIWLTMRTADVSYVAPTFQSSTYTFRDNNRILLQKSQQYGGRLQIADWATYSATQSSWVTSDGVHLTASGALAITTFIANQAARVLAGETISPAPPTTPVDSGWVTVRRGDRGTLVAIVQNALIRNGISVYGGADGIFGSYTEAAVARFQSARGLPATGIADLATAQALGVYGGTAVSPAPTPPPAPVAWTNLGIGSRGTTVAAAQRAVMNAGIYLVGGADGVYGRYTGSAVATYQSRRGLPASGVVDLATAQAMGLVSGGTPSAPSAPTWTTLRVGSRGTTVTAAQRVVVNADIYLRGGADGIYGSYTQAAVSLYQSQRGLAANGTVDLPTAQAMGLVAAPAPPVTTTTTMPASAAIAAAEEITTDAVAPAARSAETTTTLAPTVDEAAVVETTVVETTETTVVDTTVVETTAPETTATTTTAPPTTVPTTETITGVGWTDTDGDGQFDPGEPVIAGMDVRVLDAADGSPVATGATGLDGRYTLEVPAAATVIVEFWVETGRAITLADQGDDLTDSDLVLVTPEVDGAWARSRPVVAGVTPTSVVDGGFIAA